MDKEKLNIVDAEPIKIEVESIVDEKGRATAWFKRHPYLVAQGENLEDACSELEHLIHDALVKYLG